MADRDSFHQHPYALPEGATEVVLVRHGASAALVEGQRFPLFDGQTNPPLSEAGRAQAEAVAERLRTELVGGVFVSALQRTHETAAPLLEALAVESTILPELSEVRLGEFEGGEYRIRVARKDPIIVRMFAEERWDVIPGAEPFEVFGPRVRGAIETIVAAVGPDTTAVAVSHGGVIGELCRQATASRPFAFVHSDNGSISRLAVLPDGRWLLRSFNDIAHLTVVTGPVG